MGCGSSKELNNNETERIPNNKSVSLGSSTEATKHKSDHNTTNIKAIKGVEPSKFDLTQEYGSYLRTVKGTFHKMVEKVSAEITTNSAMQLFKRHKTKYYNDISYTKAIQTIKSSLHMKGDIKNIFNISNETSEMQDPKVYTTLDNKIIDSVNYSVKRLTKYYKNQKLPNEDEQFIDPLFPPNNDSIYGKRNGEFIDKNEARRSLTLKSFEWKEEDIIWLRAKDIFIGGNYYLFTNDIDIEDIMQGNIGNCYFLSSLAAMTEVPQLICQLFKSFEIPKNGCYEVAVRIDGKWKLVLVDDYFPCYIKTGKPIFAKPRGAELWVILLEKVWAKINGGYVNTIGGNSADVLNCFTSFTITSYLHSKILKSTIIKGNPVDHLWKIFTMNEKEGNIMTCNSVNNSELEKFGIIPGHAFTLVTTKEAVLNEKIVRLINLRNPWGYKEWNGAWSDHSSEWTSETKKILNLNPDDKDNGSFWISFEDFLKFFVVTQVCFVYSPQCCKHFSIKKEKADRPHIFELHLKYTNKVTLSAFKKHWRYHRKLSSDCELQMNLILVKKKNNKEIEFITSIQETENNPGVEVELTQGVYFIYVHANYKYSTFDKTRKYRILITSNKYFNALERGWDTNNYDFLQKIMISRIESTLLNNRENFTLSSNKFELTTYGFLYVVNKADEPYKIIGINECENFEILNDYKDKFKFILKPGEKILVIGLRKQYYNKFIFKIKIEAQKVIDIDTDDCDIIQPISCQMLETNGYDDTVINQDEYDFIFKQLNLDISKIVGKIDYVEYSRQYFLGKYPEIQTILDKVPNLNDGVEVIFRDIYDINNYTCYLGEWKTNQDLIKHGRGICIWHDGSYYLGQFINDISEGFGIFHYINGERIEINWLNGKMHGKGLYFRANQSFYEVQYENGNIKNG